MSRLKGLILCGFLTGITIGLICITIHFYTKKVVEEEMRMAAEAKETNAEKQLEISSMAEKVELTLSAEAKEVFQSILTDHPSDMYQAVVYEGLIINTESLEKKWSGIMCQISSHSDASTPDIYCSNSKNIAKPGISAHIITYTRELKDVIKYPEE
jgi:hypothetical protein